MSKKQLRGAAYFESLGRRDTSLGVLVPIYTIKGTWPQWAFDAYQRGRLHQMEYHCNPVGVITHHGQNKTVLYSDPVTGALRKHNVTTLL